MKNLILILSCLLATSILSGQTLTDAVRYSTLIPGGTARVMGAGSSFGSLGADFGGIGINPAGLADYRNSELMFSFSLNGGETNSSIMNNTPLTTQHPDELKLENLGIVFGSGAYSGGLQTSNFAIGLNQYNNFSQNFGFQGTTQGSIVERFAGLANGNTIDELDAFETGLAEEAGAIFDSNQDLIYETDMDSLTEVFKRQDVSRSGQVNELSFSWGGKINSNLNIGVGVGIPFISFEQNKLYQEIDTDGTIPVFNDLSYEERLATSGTGFNLKLGMSYTFDNLIKLGLAYQTPTYYTMTDNYYTALNYDCEVCNFSGEVFGSPNGSFKYRYKTPMSLTGSIGTLIKSGNVKGFVNLDVKYIDYTANTFNFNAFSNDPAEIDFERIVNGEINNQLQGAYNFNLGAEMAIDRFRVRGGYGLLGSPYFVDRGSEFDKLYSIGAGVRGDSFYFDIAFQSRDFSEGYFPYQLDVGSGVQLVENQSDISKITLTVGFKI